jgi:integrase
MSVYKPAKSRFFQFDFVIQGRRHTGSTGQTTRRAAERFEERQRIAAADGKLGEASQLTLDLAAGKYWQEHGQHRGDADQQLTRVKRLVKLFPKDIRLAEITTAVISTAIQKRRGQTFKKGKDRKDRRGAMVRAKEYAVANATVNRDVIQTLRPILRRAAIHWEAKGLPAIAWADLTLDTPRETVRVYSSDERAAWIGENGPTAALALRLLLTYGLRFGELFFPLDAFTPEADGAPARLSWIKGRKFDVPHSVPLLAADAREIAARIGRASAADLDTIWYVEEIVKDEATGEDAIKLMALTYYGLQQRLRTSSKRAGIRQGRVIHGARHHAGTTIQRRSGNMKVTQRLLGHLDPKSTNRYVHAMDADVLAALEDVEQSQNNPEAGKVDRKRRG